MTETAKEAAKEAGVVALITKLANSPNADVTTTNWLVKAMMAGAKFPGFWSGEILPPDEVHDILDWKLVQRFDTAEQAKSWQNSDERRKLIAELSQPAGGLKLTEELSHVDSSFGNVATSIVTNVIPGMEDKYFAWETRIQEAQAKFPGYRGAYLQPPAPGREGQWSTLLRFDTPQTLEKWFNSAPRQELIKETHEFVKETRFQNVSNSFPGWFPLDEVTGEGPPNWKTAMLVLLGLFPVVMLEIRFLSPYMTSLNPALASFLNLVLSVIATTYGTTPIFIKAFIWWLFPKKDEDRVVTDNTGAFILIGLFAAEIAVLWNLLPPR